jgi:dephospho-CoA kinase
MHHFVPDHPSPSLTIGLTGGIGSGKSCAADYFAELGVDIIDCDDIARTLLAPNAPLCAEVRNHFGADVFIGEQLNRAKLAAVIFAQTAQRRWLEQLMHPHIRASIQQQLTKISTAPYRMVVIPLLVETAPHPYLDRVCVVDCSESLQHQRLQQSIADDILDNQADKHHLQQQIIELHQRYIQLTKQH